MQLSCFRRHLCGKAEALMDLATELLWVDQSAEARAFHDDCLQVARKARALAYPPKSPPPQGGDQRRHRPGDPSSMNRNPFANTDRQPVEDLPPVQYAMVPRQPTEAMMRAFPEFHRLMVKAIWETMFDAAVYGESTHDTAATVASPQS